MGEVSRLQPLTFGGLGVGAAGLGLTLQAGKSAQKADWISAAPDVPDSHDACVVPCGPRADTDT